MSHADQETPEVPPPVLRIVPIENIYPHEELDPQRAQPLVKRIAQAKYWLNPPIVTPIPGTDGAYAILDGTNRFFSLRELNYPHILVQIVEYDTGQVSLDTWQHVVSDVQLDTLIPAIEDIKGVELQATDLLSAQAALSQRYGLAYIVDLTDDNIYRLISEERGIRAKLKASLQFVNTYKQEGKLDRINSENSEVVRSMYPNGTFMVVFPYFSPADILSAVRDNILIPPGITRHIIQGRAIRVNYPLEALYNTDTPLEEKNRRLEEWIQQRIDQRAVRFYAESTYIFDE
jgi:hypothetical protein